METIFIIVLFTIIVLLRVGDYIRERVFQEERDKWADERRELLNRIKPETAQIPNVDPTAIFEPVRTDEDFWNSHEELIKDKGTYPYGYEEEVRGR